MGDVLTRPVLVLNRFYSPVQLTTAKRAMVLLYGGAANAVDEQGDSYNFDLWREMPVRDEDEGISLVAGSIRVPRIVSLLKYDRVPRFMVRLTRRNLMLRDAHECQYCGRRPGLKNELNIDHVMPRSRGGPDSWENLVTSCRSCNLRKGRLTPDEANMRLKRRPYEPKWSIVSQILLGSDSSYKEWEPFLKTG